MMGKNNPLRLLMALFCALLFSTQVNADSVQQTAITIIIDDLGNNLDHGMRALALPGPVTFAVLPHSPYSKTLAAAAYKRGKEVMLHMPMDNQHDRPIGPGGLTAELDQSTFNRHLATAIRSIPHLQGINNHMGSRLTQNPARMEWLMNALKDRSLYFVDSRTSINSVAGLIAQRSDIPTLDRDVFLDHDPSPEAIHFQFKRLLAKAKEQGSAVAIGHPYPSTLGYLENVIPKLDAMGVRLVSPSGLLILHQDRPADDGRSDQPVAKASITSGSTRCQMEEHLNLTKVICT